MPIGPFGTWDMVGLETIWRINQMAADATGDPVLAANGAFLKPHVDRGHLGVKTGQGFYTYPSPAYAQAGFLPGGASKPGSK